MASISINTNIAEVNARILAKLVQLKDKEALLRPLCFDLLELMKRRIHEKGQNSSGSQIGTYSTAYMKQRIKKYNRSKDTKVIVSLTRQLENDWAVIATKAGYGIGFKNKFNLQKARWVEVKKGVIFSLTTEEQQYASDFISHYTQQALAND